MVSKLGFRGRYVMVRKVTGGPPHCGGAIVKEHNSYNKVTSG